MREFRQRKKHLHHGMVEMGSPLDVQVSPASHDRALCILDGVIRALEASGHKVRPWESYQERSHVKIGGEKIQFRIKEGMRHVDRDPKDIFADRYAPSGELRFRIWYEAPYKHEREWRDEKRRRLEGCLDQIFAGFYQAAADQKRQRAEWEEAQRRRAEEEHRAWQREEERRREQERIKDLRTAAQEWEEAKLLRAYVAELERRAQSVGLDTVYGRPLAQWASWARRVASSLDPLRRIAELEADAQKREALDGEI